MKWSGPTGIRATIWFVDQKKIDSVSVFLKQSLKICGSSLVVVWLNKQFDFIHTASGKAGL